MPTAITYATSIAVLLSLVVGLPGQGTAIQSSGTSLRQFLLQGGKSYGPLLMSDSPVVAEVLASVCNPAYGHIIVDQEHSSTDLRSLYSLLQSI